MWIGGREFLLMTVTALATYLAVSGIPPGPKIVAARAAAALNSLDTAERLLESAAMTAAPSGRDLGVSEALRRLAALYRTRGRYAEAATYLGRARVPLERAVGQYHPDVARLLDELAVVSMDREDFRTATALQDRALMIRTAVYGAYDPRVVLTLEHIVELKTRGGSFDEAMRLARRVLAMRERIHGARHPHTARALTRIGMIHRERGELDTAELYLRRALEILEPDGRTRRADGEPAVLERADELADVYTEIGLLLSEQRRFRMARRFLTRAPKLYAEPPNVSRQAETLLALAHTYREEGRRQIALAHLRVGLRLADEATRSSPVKVALHEAMGNWYSEAGMTSRARRHRSVARELLASRRSG